MITMKDRHVVVTGGKGALGSAVVDQLLQLGAICHVPSYRPVVEKDPRPGVVETGPVDLTKEEDAERFYQALPELWASIHIAGGFAMNPLTETTLTEFQRMFALNVTTAFLACREATKVIRKTGQGGRMVNVVSHRVLVPQGGMVSYISSKAAVAALTTSVAEELAAENILVNAVAPSVIDTPANRSSMPNADYSRWPSVEDIAKTIVFLASPQNTVTRGGLLPTCGKL